MLPFLSKPKSQVGVIVKERAPDKESQDDSGLEACAQDLHEAIKSNDIRKIASALKAAFEICDSEPHEEGEHVSPHSYDSSKED